MAKSTCFLLTILRLFPVENLINKLIKTYPVKALTAGTLRV